MTNTPGVLSGDVADLAVGLSLAVMRRIPAADASVRSGVWARGNMDLTTRLHGRRVGVAGFGRIGTTIARRLSGFDVEIGYFSRTARADSPYRFFDRLVDLAAWCDLLTRREQISAFERAMRAGRVGRDPDHLTPV